MTDLELPDLDESGIYTFESAEPVDLKSWAYEEKLPEEIDTRLAARSEVLEAVVTSRELVCGDNLDGRIARIAEEIEQLRLEVGDEPVATVSAKLDTIKQQKQISKYKRAAYSPQRVDIKSLQGLKQAEERITQLENVVGPQTPPVSLGLMVSQLKQKLDLLSLNPRQVEDAVAALKSQVVPNDKVSAVYERLESVGPVLASLPQVANRLKSLEVLHLDTAATQGFLRDAEATMRQMSVDIERWNQRLDKIETGLCGSKEE